MLVTIEVDPDNGIPISCKNCPIARGINLHLKDDYTTRVGAGYWRIVDKEDNFLYWGELPDNVNKWRRNFDCFIAQPKMSFVLEIPDQFLKDKPRTFCLS